MIKNVFNAIATSIRGLLRKWPALLLILVVYAALLGSVYLFFSTSVGTVGQVALTFVLPVAALVLFFVLQTMAARFGVEPRAPRLLGCSLRDFWSLLLISIPIVLLGWLIVVLTMHVEDSFKPAVQQAARNLPARLKNLPRPAAQAVPWQVTLATTVANVLLVVALPLAAIHLWIRTAREGLKSAIKSSARLIAGAFAPRSVLIYALGLLMFAAVPYFLVFTRTPAGNAWVEAGLLVARLVLAALFSLIGWVVTVGALAELKSKPGEEERLIEGTSHAAVST